MSQLILSPIVGARVKKSDKSASDAKLSEARARARDLRLLQFQMKTLLIGYSRKA